MLYLLLCFAEALEFSISGFSSGAFMTMQIHFSYSSLIPGVGMAAGGPYHCVQASFSNLACTSFPGLINIQELYDYAKKSSQDSLIDPIENLKNSKVWLQAGENDVMIRPGVVKKVEEFYRKFTSNIKTVYNIENQHAFVSEDYGNPCWFYGKPYISDCNFDSAGDILNHIYGTLLPKQGYYSNRLFKFSQVEYGSDDAGMADYGYVYVPKNCLGKNCRVHVFLHGCGMNTDYIDDAITLHGGFNQWAQANDLIIIYPQAAKHHPLNYGACWDGSGNNDSLYDTKYGKQVSVIYKITQDIYKILESGKISN